MQTAQAILLNSAPLLSPISAEGTSLRARKPECASAFASYKNRLASSSNSCSLSLRVSRECGFSGFVSRTQRNRFASRLAVEAAVKWVLEPAGDGDASHIGEPVEPQVAIELVNDVSVIGRSPEKADIIIPVSTVSGRHALLEKKNSVLFVTDLNSTNGTFVGNTQLKSGAATVLVPGSILTFGDEHLAQYKFVVVDEAVPEPAEEPLPESA